MVWTDRWVFFVTPKALVKPDTRGIPDAKDAAHNQPAGLVVDLEGVGHSQTAWRVRDAEEVGLTHRARRVGRAKGSLVRADPAFPVNPR